MRGAFERAFELQAYYRAYGEAVLGDEWQPPVARVDVSRSEIEEIVRTVARILGITDGSTSGPARHEEHEYLKRALKELVSFCELIYSVVLDWK